jgi:HAD superfamily hydrolase (TIGR01458 family)
MHAEERSPQAKHASGDASGVVRGALLDVDGVLHVSLDPIPGAAEALRALDRAGVACRLLTNTTTASRATLGQRLRDIGLPVGDEMLFTAPVATAEFIARRRPGARCYLIAKGDVAEDFAAAGLTVLPDDAAEADAVVVGGAEGRLTYERLNRAYRLLLAGAELVAMHRNRAWRTAEGMQLDSGPFVTALEEAAGVRAEVVGKPTLAFFREALRDLGVPPRQVVMVGDDAVNDLRPARRLGLRTALVRTGKAVAEADAAEADVVLDSVAGLPRALGIGDGGEPGAGAGEAG